MNFTHYSFQKYDSVKIYNLVDTLVANNLPTMVFS